MYIKDIAYSPQLEVEQTIKLKPEIKLFAIT